MNKALFLDRDGVLIKDCGYPHLPEDLQIREEVIPFLKQMSGLGYLLIIVTNQSGIARGIFSIEQYKKFESLLEKELLKLGVKITETFFCPYLENHIDRKPKPGMILKAAKKYDIDLAQSIMIGDKDSDRIEHPLLKSYILQGDYPVNGDFYNNVGEITEVLGL